MEFSGIIVVLTDQALEEAVQERGSFGGDAHNLVRCLSIKLEIELGLGPTIVPVGLCTKNHDHTLLSSISVFSVPLWCVFSQH